MARAAARGARGFSLLELTLVLAIIGVLMAIAAVSIFGRGEAAKVQATWATMQTVKNAIQQYQLNNSAYPDTVGRLQAGKMPYLDADKRIQDGWGQDLLYSPQGQAGKPYDLFSKGPNLQFENGAGDDLSVWKEPTKQ